MPVILNARLTRNRTMKGHARNLSSSIASFTHHRQLTAYRSLFPGRALNTKRDFIPEIQTMLEGRKQSRSHLMLEALRKVYNANEVADELTR